MITEKTEQYDVQFNFKPGMEPSAFGPFDTREKAEECVRQLRADCKHDPFASGYRIVKK